MRRHTDRVCCRVPLAGIISWERPQTTKARYASVQLSQLSNAGGTCGAESRTFVRSPQSVTMLGVAVVALILITEADALAYVDPWTGSYLFLFAIAGGLAGIYTVRRYCMR